MHLESQILVLPGNLCDHWVPKSELFKKCVSWVPNPSFFPGKFVHLIYLGNCAPRVQHPLFWRTPRLPQDICAHAKPQCSSWNVCTSQTLVFIWAACASCVPNLTFSPETCAPWIPNRTLCALRVPNPIVFLGKFVRQEPNLPVLSPKSRPDNGKPHCSLFL